MNNIFMYCKNCGNEINKGVKFCKNCGQEIFTFPRLFFMGNLFKKLLNKKLIIIFIILFFLIIFLFFYDNIFKNVDNQYNSDIFDGLTQEEIAATVVNIFCPSTSVYEESSGGSGTIIDESGIILTNSHVIPQDSENIYVGDDGCLVTLPDPITGYPKEIYWAEPLVFSELSDRYDLAYMVIKKPYYDEETNELLGEYDKSFPNFYNSACKDEYVKLGEPIRVFGYPAISGGYHLTITDGIVSSFPGDGMIVTSAKISHGNSGGLAVDANGCMIGIPTMVSTDENESLGIIISGDLISGFSDELDVLLKNK